MRRFTSTLVALLLVTLVFGQTRIDLGNPRTELKVKAATQTTLQLETKLQSLQFQSQTTEVGVFDALHIEAFRKDHSRTPGTPDLPVYTQMIEVPHGADIVVSVLDYDEVIYDLDDFNLGKLPPLQESYSKSSDPESHVFAYDQTVYEQDHWIEPEIVRSEFIGVMRGVGMGQLIICPFRYNPATNELAVLNNIKLNVAFENADLSTTQINKEKYYAPQFESAYKHLLNYQEPAAKDALTQYPIKYVIISDPAFETTLQPFVDWKTKSGYNIIEAYIGSEVSNSTSSIHNYLQGLYDAGTPSDPAPTYVLFVGDYDNLTAYNGEVGSSHVTDLHYCEFDGGSDYLPDMYYGRISAESTSELQNALDKILFYEEYQMTDASYLNNCVMIAGVDSDMAPAYGDGQIYYGVSEYFNTAHDFSNIYAYYYSLTNGPHSTGISSNNNGAASAIRGNISNGVGFANYTAHCSSDGWADPSFSRSNISAMTNVNKYPVMVGNCCQSNKFEEEDSFGEMIMYAQNKGAVAYIGATDFSYWDEDFYWGAGIPSLSISQANADNHTYANTDLGVYDGVWHENGEAYTDWYYTAYSMIYHGNMSVNASTSSRKQYYWEIYQVFGDPSLMPYMTEPEAMTVTYGNPIVGATSLSVDCEPYTYVAISQNGVLLDAEWSGSGSSVNLTFTALTSDAASVVATKQDRVPHINDFTPIVPNPPICDFSGTPTSILEGQSVVFTDLSQYAAEWSWDFGDGNGSNEANPTHVYSSAGTYTVALTINNALGEDTETKTDYITVAVNTNPPTSDFVADMTSVIVGGTVNFTDLSQNNPSSWAWTFNGGTPASSTDQNPSVVYNTPGTYTVELVASNGYGTGSTETKSGYITVELPTYCDAGSSSAGYEHISNVVLGDIDNASSATTYSDFTSFVTNAFPSDNINFIVTIGSAYNSDQVLIWVDWNHDGDFEDVGEDVYTSATGQGPHSGTISVPAGQTFGDVRVRIRMEDTGNDPVGTPCGYSGYGEVEDYTINIVNPNSPPSCAITPQPSDAASDVDYSLTSITWEGIGADDYDVYFGTNPNPMTNTPVNVTTNDYSVSLDPSTTYYWTIVSHNANGDATGCDVWSFTTSATHLIMSDGSVTTCSGLFMDSGAEGNYSNSENLTYTIYPATPGAMIEVEFTSLNIEPDGSNCYDDLAIYDGEDASATHIGTYCGTDPAVIGTAGVVAATNPAGALTFVFTSDAYVAEAGWTANVSCTDIPTFDLTFNVTDGANPVQGATVALTGFGNQTTDASGNAVFTSVSGVDVAYSVTADCFDTYTGSVTITADQTENTTMTMHTYDATIDVVSPMCANASAITLTAAESGGVWSGTGVIGDQFYPATAGAGDHVLTYTLGSGVCETSDSETIHVDATVDAAINAVADVCETSAAITLTAASTGGTWSGTGVSADTFDPSTGAGDYTITYNVVNGTCSDSDTETVHVDGVVDATIDAMADVCENGALVTLTAVTAGGTWTGTGVSGDEFIPATAGAGDHVITYNVVNGACSDSDTETVHVDGAVDATIDAISDVCEASASIALTAVTAGGTWSGTGVSADTFDPATGAGDYTITYNVVNGTCSDSDTETVHVDGVVDATIDAMADVCENGALVSLSAATAGGTWSGTGVSADTFDPSTGAGDYTITYNVVNGACSDSDTETLHVDAMPDATITDPGAFCTGDAAVTLVAATIGGTWSGNGVSGDQFDPVAAGVGTHTITYEVSNGECLSSDQIDFYISDGYDATIDAVADLCETAAVVTLTAVDAGGTWTGTGVTGNVFDPAVAGEGDHVITYSIAGSCGDTDETTIHVDAMPDATIITEGPMCTGDDDVTLEAQQDGGTWSGTGVSADTFSPATAGVGTNTVNYTILNGACTASEDVDILVGGEPVIDATVTDASSSTASDGAANIAISGGLSPYEILWSNSDTDETIENVPAGTYSVMVTDAAGCSSNTPIVVDFTNSLGEVVASYAVYPNPAKNDLFVELDNMNVSRIELTNVLGQTMTEIKVNSDILQIDVSGFESGIYFVRIHADGELYTHRIMID